MSSKFFQMTATCGLLLSLCACKDNPELVRKREEQRTEIKRLEGELSVLEEKLKDIPPDRTKELILAKGEADAQTVEIEKLEQEVTVLDARKKELETRFSEYRRKYPLKSN
jgi:Tfp pilus assembly protein PilN